MFGLQNNSCKGTGGGRQSAAGDFGFGGLDFNGLRGFRV